MVTEAAPALQGASEAHIARPYPPGWTDRLNDRLQRWPLRGALFYIGALLVGFVYVNVIRWVNGKAPIGSFHFVYPFFVAYAPYGLAALAYLDRVADGALAVFRPVLGVSDAEYEQLRYRLTTLPARGTWIAFLLGACAAIPFMLNLPDEPIKQLVISRQTLYVQLGFIYPVFFGILFVLIYHTIHQLRMVSHIHAVARNVDLFESEPLYAFSGLTVRTAMVFIVLGVYSATVRPEVTLRSPVIVAIYSVALPLAVACFVLPLVGMHHRMVREKKRLQSEADRHLREAIARLYRRMDDEQMDDLPRLQAGIASLVQTRDVLVKIPTWPWQPGTFRGFLTTLLLPIALPVLVWAIQQIVGRVAGL